MDPLERMLTEMTHSPTLTRAQRVDAFIEQVRRRLIVSCQALPHEPLHGAQIMARMALAAQQGGAAAIRANGPADIRAIRAVVDLPIIGLFKEDIPGYPVYITPTMAHVRAIIGLFKEDIPGYPVYITPTMAHVRAVVDAGADIVAIDATARPRPQPGTLADFIAAIHAETGCPVLADIATFEEGLAAEAAGADLVSTTMSGYTDDSPKQADPDLDLVRQLAPRLRVPLLAEGRYRTPEQVRQAFTYGAVSAIVGGAITRPQEITRWFVEGIERNE